MRRTILLGLFLSLLASPAHAVTIAPPKIKPPPPLKKVIPAKKPVIIEQKKPTPTAPGKKKDEPRTWRVLFDGQELKMTPILYNSKTNQRVELDQWDKLPREYRFYYLPISLAEMMGTQVKLDKSDRAAFLYNPEKTFRIKAGLTSTDPFGRKLMVLARPPIWEKETLYVPSEFFINLGGTISFNRYDPEIKVYKTLTTLESIQPLFDQERARLILKASRPLMYTAFQSQRWTTLRLLGARLSPALREQTTSLGGDRLLSDVKIEEPMPGVVQLTLKTRYTSPKNIYVPENADQLIVDFPKLFQQHNAEAIAPGAWLESRYEGTANGPLSLHFMKVDTKKGFALRPLLAGGSQGFALETVTSLASRYPSLVAINAGYFSTKPIMPVGLLMADGEVITSPLYGRTFLGITREGRCFIGSTQKGAAIKASDREEPPYSFDGINATRQKNQMVLYTPRFGLTTGTAPQPDAVEFAIASDGTVMNTVPNDAPIPEGGYAISAHGKAKVWLEERFPIGSRVVIDWPLKADFPEAQHLIAGGPLLVANGKVKMTAEAEQFKSDIVSGRAPRTAFGLLPDEEILLLTVDGRQPDLSIGLTLDELAGYLRQLGAVDAINFDGGGSTTMVVQNSLINSPSDGKPRKVSNALVIQRLQ